MTGRRQPTSQTPGTGDGVSRSPAPGAPARATHPSQHMAHARWRRPATTASDVRELTHTGADAARPLRGQGARNDVAAPARACSHQRGWKPRGSRDHHHPLRACGTPRGRRAPPPHQPRPRSSTPRPPVTLPVGSIEAVLGYRSVGSAPVIRATVLAGGVIDDDGDPVRPAAQLDRDRSNQRRLQDRVDPFGAKTPAIPAREPRPG